MQAAKTKSPKIYRSPFRYPGGKSWFIPAVRKWLLQCSKRPRQFIEPFAGGANVGLTVACENLADRVVLVELDEAVAAVWQTVLNGKGTELANKILQFKINDQAVRRILSKNFTQTEDIAFATILKNRVQHGGIIAPGASLLKHGENGKGISSRWYAQTLHDRIMDIAAVKDRIDFHMDDAFTFIRKFSRNKRAVFFIDPPYTVAGRRLYRHSQLDHERLFRLMRGVQGEFIMTYDDTTEIVRLAEKYELQYERVAMRNRNHADRFELVIGRDLNFLCDA